MEFRLKALTDIWTGGVEGKPDKLYLTGIKGSIRWWYEALIRGLGGYACDPSDDNKRCSLDLEKFKKLRSGSKTEEDALNLLICPACQMFGCTNWGSKFILRVEDDNNKVVSKQIGRNHSFILKFIERKRVADRERKLLNATIKIIVEYGAIGGKTTLKPSEVPYKNCKEYQNPKTRARGHHLDYGLIAFQSSQPSLDTDCRALPACLKQNKADLEKKNENDWPNLKNFWFVKGSYINRIEHNILVDRQAADPKLYKNNAIEFNVFSGGYIKANNGRRIIPNSLQTTVNNRNLQSSGESKKIFSFHGFTHADCNDCVKKDFDSRCFGYVRDASELKNIGIAIKQILNSKSYKYEFKEGMEVLDDL